MILAYFQYTLPSLSTLCNAGGKNRIHGSISIHVKHPVNKKLWPSSIDISVVTEMIETYFQMKNKRKIHEQKKRQAYFSCAPLK